MDASTFVVLLPCIVTFLAWAGGGVVSIVTGFGCGLFAMPIMLLCVPTEQALPVACVMSCVAMSLILLRFWRNIDWHHFLFLSVAAVPGAFCGMYMLQTVAIRWIEFGFGVFLLASVAWQLLSKRLLASSRPAPGQGVEFFFGFFSGVINGITGMGGPAMGVYASLANWDKDMARGTFGIFFGLNLALCALLQFRAGLVGPAEIRLIAWAVPGAILGTLAGIPLAGRIRQETFMKLLLCVITISGFFVIAKSMS